MSQTSTVLAHLTRGSHLTPLEAIGLYGIYRLAARIYDLRTAGHKINTVVKNDTRGRPYARYTLQAATIT